MKDNNEVALKDKEMVEVLECLRACYDKRLTNYEAIDYAIKCINQRQQVPGLEDKLNKAGIQLTQFKDRYISVPNVMRIVGQRQQVSLEVLAAHCHKQWSGWMHYLFSQCVNNKDGTYTIPKWGVERWLRQLRTSYEDLSEKEKESDREEARAILTELEGEGDAKNMDLTEFIHNKKEGK